LPGVAYPGVRDNCSTINTKTWYDEYLTPGGIIFGVCISLLRTIMHEKAYRCRHEIFSIDGGW